MEREKHPNIESILYKHKLNNDEINLNRVYRHIAYRRFVVWVCHSLGWGNRKFNPAFVISRIRQQCPSKVTPDISTFVLLVRVASPIMWWSAGPWQLQRMTIWWMVPDIQWWLSHVIKRISMREVACTVQQGLSTIWPCSLWNVIIKKFNSGYNLLKLCVLFRKLIF